MKLFGWFRRDMQLPRELEGPRNGIIVTHHAKEQAGERYRRGNPWAIIADVADALEQNRIGTRSPSIPVHKARRGARLVWTADGSRIYVVYQRSRTWFVLTALPTDETASAATPAPTFRPNQGMPAVAAAIIRASEHLETTT